MPLLSVQGIDKSFGGVHAVRSLTFEVRTGEVLGMIGPNGAGKTTAFGMISGFISPDAGDILYDGQSIVNLRPDQICKLGIVRTFQIVKPFARLSVVDNVMVGSLNRVGWNDEARVVAEEAIETVGLSPFKEREAARLPLAMRKRVEIARALATQPRLLLLDEVLAGQNPVEIRESLEIIRGVNSSGTTIIMIEHVMSAIMNISDRIVVLDYGQKIAEGKPMDIVKNPTVLDAYLGDMRAASL